MRCREFGAALFFLAVLVFAQGCKKDPVLGVDGLPDDQQFNVQGVQFHPEARPGPTDTAYLFDDFLRNVVRTGRRRTDVR